MQVEPGVSRVAEHFRFCQNRVRMCRHRSRTANIVLRVLEQIAVIIHRPFAFINGVVPCVHLSL